MDILLHLLHIGLCKGFESGEALEERRRDLIYALVGALGGEPHGKQQLVIFSPVKGAACLRVFLQQQPHDLLNLFGCPHVSLPHFTASD